MKKYDEPMCQDSDNEDYCYDKISDVPEEIRKLLQTESFAVLATQGQGQPYASLMSFAVSEDLKHFIFATPRETRKYSLLSSSDRVAIMVDNRSHMPSSLNRISALTVTGKARLLRPEDAGHWTDIFIQKHPYQETFIQAPSTAIVLVEVYRYFFVRRFQEVTEWSPQQE